MVGELPTASQGVKAAPAVRRLAGKLGVDLAGIKGTGPRGSITSGDVEKAAKPRLEGVMVERLTGVRRAMAQAMAKSGAEIVPATVTDEADIENWPDAMDVTIRLLRAVQAGVAAEPALNAWYHAEQGERWLHEDVHVGLAIDTEQGLFAPVLRGIGSRSDADLREGLNRLRRDVEAREIPAEELHGQTLALSNFGMISGLHAALVIVPPQVASLGAGRSFNRGCLEAGNPVEHRMLPLSLTFDHRVVTGGEAARFMAAVKASLENTPANGE